MKKLRKAVALLLVLVMSAGLFTSFALADESSAKPVLKVVAVGDSTCNGHGNSDFGVYSARDSIITREDGVLQNYYYYNKGFLTSGSDCAYTVLLKDYIQKKLPAYDVQFTNLGISGSRSNEIRAILDPSYTGDIRTQGYFGEYGTFGYFERIFDLGGKSFREFYTDEIKSADVITLDCLMNAFTDEFVDHAMAVLDGDYETLALYGGTTADLLGRITPGAKKLLDGMAKQFISLLGDKLPGEMIEGLLDALTYCFCDLFINFSEVVRLIRELNPDARLLVGGTFNPFRGLSAELMGVELDVGSLCAVLLGTVDAYISAIEPRRNEYSYFSVPADVELGREYLASFDSVWELPVSTLNCLIDDIFYSNHSMLAAPLCNIARGIAREQGVPYGTSYYARDVFAAFADVRENGDSADPMNKILVDVFGNVVDLMIKSMRLTTGDGEAAIAAFSSNYYDVLNEYKTRPFEELNDAERTELFIVCMMSMVDGYAAHFSPRGCEQKYEAAVKALGNYLPNSFRTPGILNNIGLNAVVGLINTLRQPLINAISNIFGSGLISTLVARTLDAAFPLLTGYFKYAMR